MQLGRSFPAGGSDRVSRTFFFESIDMLIHSAGDFCMGSFSSLSADKLDHLFRVNLRAPFRSPRGFAPTSCQSGEVVFINSTAALHASLNWAAYSAIKAGLEMLADSSIRTELDEQGIRVPSVYPGRTATPMQKEIHRLGEQNLQPGRPATRRHCQSIVHILRMPNTAEVADLVILPRRKSLASH